MSKLKLSMQPKIFPLTRNALLEVMEVNLANQNDTLAQPVNE